MPWTTEHLLIAVAGAFATGIINALAGNGSVITLTILTEVLGLPGNLANGTNRVGVFLNSIGAMAGFAGKRDLKFSSYLRYILPVIFGAVIGTIVATQVTNDQFMWVFRFLMILMFFVVLVNPERWLIVKAEPTRLPAWLEWPIMLILGFYGGFIQMGMGVFYLAFLVLVGRLPLIESNMIKALVVGAFTLLAVIIFAISGQIIWSIGLVMGAAQFAGGWISAHYASRIPGTSKVAYIILVIAVALSILKLFDVF